MRKKCAKFAIAAFVMTIGLLGAGSGAKASGLSAEELNDRVINSQGNLDDVESERSSRYQETADIERQLREMEMASNTDQGGVPVTDPAAAGSQVPVTDPAAAGSQVPVTDPAAAGSQVPVTDPAAAGDQTLPAEQTPTVMNVTLYETYHSDYQLYELSIMNLYFLYSNVSNGDITDKAVSVDIPAGITYRMEKDGEEIPYQSGEVLSEEGSYVLNVEVTSNLDMPVSQQVLYRSVLRFRIQAKTGAGQTEQTGTPSGTESSEEDYSDLFGDDPTEEDLEGIDFGDTELDEEHVNQMISDALGDGYETNNIEGYLTAAGMAISYDEENGYYRYLLASGVSFFSNVPNGMITNSGVTIFTNDDIQFTVYRDGEVVEYTPGTAITAPGSYMVYPSQEGILYLSIYENANKPMFHFRIPEEYVNDISIVAAPWSCSITGATLNDEPVGFEPGWCQLEQDGVYRITMQTPAGIQEVQLQRDTVAPRFYVVPAKNKADFYYMTMDLASYEVYQNGILNESGSILNTLNKSGNYLVRIYDTAGNMSSVSLNIAYGLNTGSVVFIVIAVVLVAVLILYVHRVRRSFVVR